jgi:hypothetical protein
MTWLCLKDKALAGSQMCIVTGPRIDLAIALIYRMKRLFAGLVTFDTKEIVIELNAVKIEAFPSHHLDAMRGLPNVSFILLDEADFFPPGQQADARDVSERYIADFFEISLYHITLRLLCHHQRHNLALNRVVNIRRRLMLL